MKQTSFFGLKLCDVPRGSLRHYFLFGFAYFGPISSSYSEDKHFFGSFCFISIRFQATQTSCHSTQPLALIEYEISFQRTQPFTKFIRYENGTQATYGQNIIM